LRGTFIEPFCRSPPHPVLRSAPGTAGSCYATFLLFPRAFHVTPRSTSRFCSAGDQHSTPLREIYFQTEDFPNAVKRHSFLSSNRPGLSENYFSWTCPFRRLGEVRSLFFLSTPAPPPVAPVSLFVVPCRRPRIVSLMLSLFSPPLCSVPARRLI